jgi:hypothetical protein
MVRILPLFVYRPLRFFLTADTLDLDEAAAGARGGGSGFFLAPAVFGPEEAVAAARGGLSGVFLAAVVFGLDEAVAAAGGGGSDVVLGATVFDPDDAVRIAGGRISKNSASQARNGPVSIATRASTGPGEAAATRTMVMPPTTNSHQGSHARWR